MSDQAFDTYAEEYDAWYDSEPGATIFAMEVECLRPLLHRYSPPYLEVGVGSGRFAQSLGIEYGVDPASALLRMAEARGIRIREGYGEKLPFHNGMFGAVIIALTICFVDDPVSVLREAWRVLISGGGLVLGLILRNNPWGAYYSHRGKAGHPIYSRARFFSIEETENFLKSSGFKVLGYHSTLFQRPGQKTYHFESPVSGYYQLAGFVAIESRKQGR